MDAPLEEFFAVVSTFDRNVDRNEIEHASCEKLLKMQRRVSRGEHDIKEVFSRNLRAALRDSPSGGALCAANVLIVAKPVAPLLETYLDLCDDFSSFLLGTIALHKAPEKPLFDALSGEPIGEGWRILFDRIKTGPTVARRESVVVLSHQKDNVALRAAVRDRLEAKKSDPGGTAKMDEKKALLRLLESIATGAEIDLIEKFVDVRSDAVAHFARRIATELSWPQVDIRAFLDTVDERSEPAPPELALTWKDGTPLSENQSTWVYGRLLDLHERERDPRLDEVWSDVLCNPDAFVNAFATQPFALAQLGGELATDALKNAMRRETVAARRTRIQRALLRIDQAAGGGALYVQAFSGPKKQRESARTLLFKNRDTLWTERGWPEKAERLRTEHAARLGREAPVIDAVAYRIDDKLFVAHNGDMVGVDETKRAPDYAIPAGPMTKQERTALKKIFKSLDLKPAFRSVPATGTLPNDRDALLHGIESMTGSTIFESSKRVFNTLRRRGYLLGPLFDWVATFLGSQTEFFFEHGLEYRVTLHFEPIPVEMGQWLKADEDIETRLEKIEITKEGVPCELTDLPTNALWFLMWDLDVACFGKVPATVARVPKTKVDAALDLMARSSLSQEQIDPDFAFHYSSDDRYRKGGPRKKAALKEFEAQGIKFGAELTQFIKRYGVPDLGYLDLDHYEADGTLTAEQHLGLFHNDSDRGGLWVQWVYYEKPQLLPIGETFEDAAVVYGSGALEAIEQRLARKYHPRVYDALQDVFDRVIATCERLHEQSIDIFYEAPAPGIIVTTPAELGVEVAKNKFGFDWQHIPFVLEDGAKADFSELNDDVEYTDKLMDYGEEVATKLLRATREVVSHDNRSYRFYPLETVERVVSVLEPGTYSRFPDYEPITRRDVVSIPDALKRLNQAKSYIKPKK